MSLRIGVDLGGSKIAALAFAAGDRVLFEHRIATPRDDYAATIRAIAGIVAAAESEAGASGHVGIAMPGSISPRTGLVQNANSTWLNARPFDRDVEAALARPVRFANDADCLALSESADGAARDARSVFAVILGTGCGGGLVVDGRLVAGPNGCAGEWGHMPLPWPDAGLDEHPGPVCWCGRRSCLETWLSGPALSGDHARRTGERLAASAIAASPAAAARETLRRHTSRLARGLALVVDLCDPEMIVLGGGLSLMPHLYRDLPEAVAPHVFAAEPRTVVRPALHGDASGVRGAARLWDGAGTD